MKEKEDNFEKRFIEELKIIEKYTGKMRGKDKGLVKTFFKIFDEIEKLNNNKTYTETKNEC